MTDRHAGYIIVLAEDIREDDAEHIINALRMVRGVAAVEPVVANIELHIARRQARTEFRELFREFFLSLDGSS